MNNKFILFFFGTPQRLLGTAAGIFVLWGLYHLDETSLYLDRLLCVLQRKVFPLVIIVGLALLFFKKNK